MSSDCGEMLEDCFSQRSGVDASRLSRGLSFGFSLFCSAPYEELFSILEEKDDRKRSDGSRNCQCFVQMATAGSCWRNSNFRLDFRSATKSFYRDVHPQSTGVFSNDATNACFAATWKRKEKIRPFLSVSVFLPFFRSTGISY